MKINYTITLDPKKDELEQYEIEDKNLINIRIQPPGSKTIDGKGYRVELSLSIDAMLGLGTELIRTALKAKEKVFKNGQFFEHLRPMDASLIVENMGVYLMPDSAELLITLKDFGEVKDISKKL